MYIFNIILNASKQLSKKSKQWWLFEFSFLMLLLLRSSIILTHILWSHTPCFHLSYVLHFSFDFISNSLSELFSVNFVFDFLNIEVFSFGSHYGMNNLVHYDNVLDLVDAVVVTSFWIFMKVVFAGHFITIWSKDKMNVLELHFE